MTNMKHSIKTLRNKTQKATLTFIQKQRFSMYSNGNCLHIFHIIGPIPLLYLFLVNLCSISYFFPSPTPVELARSSWFDVGNSSATVFDPASEAAAFFIQFGQSKANNLDPEDF